MIVTRKLADVYGLNKVNKILFLKDVLAERANQINYKRLEAEQQLKLKEAENELLLMAYETNERLQAESDRLEREAALQYRHDLKRQIDYTTVLRVSRKQFSLLY